MESLIFSPFLGSWREIKTENLEEFLKAKGTPWILRKLMVNSNLSETIEVRENKLIISYTALGIMSGSHEYPVDGSSSSYLNYNKEEVTSVCSISPNIISIELRGGSCGTVRTNRSLVQDKLVVTHSVIDQNTTATRTFEKIEK